MAIEILRNNSTLEITGNTGIKVLTETLDSGEASERKKFTISGKTQLNKPTIIGTLKLTASENKRFSKAPGINKISNKNIGLNSKLRLSLVSVERNTSNNIIEYLYNLIYTAKESVNKLNKLNYILENKTIGKVTKVTGIDRVHCGHYKISKKGERRRISIYGTPGATFKIAVVKNQVIRDTVVAGLPSHGPLGLPSSTFQTDILSSQYSNGSIEGGQYTIIDGKLNTKGVYSFFQKFPKILYSDISTKGLGAYTFYILPTLLRGKLESLGFRKPNSGTWKGWYSKNFAQIYVPKVTLRATTNSVLYTINGRVIPDGASTQTYDRIFRSKRSKKQTEVKYVLKALSSSHSFSVLKTPVFGGGSSDWTNSVSSSNGGAYLRFRNISVALSTSSWTNDTCTISFRIDASRWGTQDLIMSAALNTFAGCS